MSLQVEVEQWIRNPVINNHHDSLEIASGYLVELVSHLKEHPESRKEIGPLIGRVKGLQKQIEGMEWVDWISVGSGKIAIGHRPSKKLFQDLRLQGATHILTLLSMNEGARQVKEMCAREGLKWLHFPMESAKAPDRDRFGELRKLFGQMKSALEEKARIYIHCSAGIHRTGMITNAFLRFTGMNSEQAMEELGQLRQETSEGVGEERLAFAELFLSVKE